VIHATDRFLSVAGPSLPCLSVLLLLLLLLLLLKLLRCVTIAVFSLGSGFLIIIIVIIIFNENWLAKCNHTIIQYGKVKLVNVFVEHSIYVIFTISLNC